MVSVLVGCCLLWVGDERRRGGERERERAREREEVLTHEVLFVTVL